MRTTPISSLRHPTTSLIVRWLLIATCTVVAFWPAILHTLNDFQSGGLLGYLFIKPVMATFAAIGIARRRRDKVPVYDREVDAIVGGLCLIFAMAVAAFLVPRYAENFLLLRVDLFGFWIFVFGACCLMFGLRASGGYWPVWLLVMALGPITYRWTVTALGGTWAAAGTVLLVDVAVSMAIAVARTRRRALVGFLATVALGAAILTLLVRIGAHGQVIQLVPAIASGLVIGAAFVAYATWVAPTGTPLVPHRVSVVPRPWHAAIALVLVTLVFVLIPFPDVRSTLVAAAGPPSVPAGGGQVVPAGWTQDWIEDYPGAARYFGVGATVTRQQMTTTEVVPEWDEKGRKRTIVVDTTRTFEPSSLLVNQVYSMYDVVSDRRSPIFAVDLGHGIAGYFGTVVDDDILLTWSGLVFEWERAGAVERVTLISVDDHDQGAPFPSLQLDVRARLGVSATILLRGNRAIEDLQSQYKDRDMLTAVATELVDAQMEARQ